MTSKRAKDKGPKHVSKKKQKEAEVEETKQRKKGDVIDGLIHKTISEPSYKTITRALQIVKNVFSSVAQDNENLDYPDEDGKGGGKKKVVKPKVQTNIQRALATSEEYVKLLQFFGGKLPQLILTFCDIKVKNKEPINVGKLQ